MLAEGGQAGVPYALVITDLGMPYIDGRRVAAAIHAMSETTPIILLTGWGNRLQDEGDVPPGVSCVLAKPAKLHELRAAFSELTQRTHSAHRGMICGVCTVATCPTCWLRRDNKISFGLRA